MMRRDLSYGSCLIKVGTNDTFAGKQRDGTGNKKKKEKKR